MPTREKRARKLGVSLDMLTDSRGRHGNHRKGVDCPRWNDGRIISSHGYVKIRVGKEHPLADPNGYAYEHLVVWVSAGKEPPGDGQIIHHRNEKKTDNRIENLRVCNRSEHGIGHASPLSDTEIVSIREAYSSGIKNMPELSTEYNVPHQRISKIVRGEVRVSAGGPISHDDNRKKNTRR